jgi:lipid-A-disaccharide synthase
MDEKAEINVHTQVRGESMSRKLFIFAGEKSGDLLGSYLLQAIKERLPKYLLEGVGGPEMRENGFECIMRMEEFEIMGFSDIIRSIPKLKRQFHLIRNHILEGKPEGVIFIDYPGFNLRMAKALRNQGFQGKLIQYISPTVWAWGKNRTEKMAKTLDLLMTIYPFENACFQETSLKVKYVGNPIREIISKYTYDDNWAKLFGIKDPKELVAIFPGSRKGEIQNNLPYQLRAAELLKKDNPSITFAISCAHEKIMPLMQDILNNNSLKLNRDIFLVPKGYSYELMRDCRSAIAKSGTVTLELALHSCPTVTIYKLTLLNRLIAKYFMKLNLPHYCIVNILKGKTVFPELIAHGLNSKNIYKHISSLHHDTKERALCITECKELREILQDNDASINAAAAIEEVLG